MNLTAEETLALKYLEHALRLSGRYPCATHAGAQPTGTSWQPFELARIAENLYARIGELVVRQLNRDWFVNGRRLTSEQAVRSELYGEQPGP